MFHNRYTISIGRLATLMDSRNLNLVKRFNMLVPKFMLEKPFRRLMKEVGETLNQSALQREIESGILKTKLFNKAFNLYPALCNIVSITWDQQHLDKVEEITGMKMLKLEDRQGLIDETKRLQDKYRELSVEHAKEGVSFASVIISTEIVLGMNISREIKLFEFQHYMKAASDKIKQLEKNGKINR
jgi:hypothetical protein